MVIVSGTGLATSFSNDGSIAHVESDFSHSYEFASHTFSGSGTAVIAAEKTGRICCAIEIDPRYVQATITRWERFSGQRAEPLDRTAVLSRVRDGR